MLFWPTETLIHLKTGALLTNRSNIDLLKTIKTSLAFYTIGFGTISRMLRREKLKKQDQFYFRILIIIGF